jgi:flagellar biosynthesis/type III secretory pathway M-ring protein FliF/YscJ
MKKKLELFAYAAAAIAMVGVAVVSFAQPANADLWTLYKNSKLEESPSVAHRVNAMGYDVRVYEFKPKTQPDYTCVMAFGQTNPVGMQCFPDQQ